MLSTLADSGLEVVEAERLTLIYDGKGKPGKEKEALFEDHIKEILRNYSAYHSSASLTQARAQSVSSSWRSITSSSSHGSESFGACSSRTREVPSPTPKILPAPPPTSSSLSPARPPSL